MAQAMVRAVRVSPVFKQAGHLDPARPFRIGRLDVSQLGAERARVDANQYGAMLLPHAIWVSEIALNDPLVALVLGDAANIGGAVAGAAATDKLLMNVTFGVKAVANPVAAGNVAAGLHVAANARYITQLNALSVAAVQLSNRPPGEPANAAIMGHAVVAAEVAAVIAREVANRNLVRVYLNNILGNAATPVALATSIRNIVTGGAAGNVTNAQITALNAVGLGNLRVVMDPVLDAAHGAQARALDELIFHRLHQANNVSDAVVSSPIIAVQVTTARQALMLAARVIPAWARELWRNTHGFDAATVTMYRYPTGDTAAVAVSLAARDFVLLGAPAGAANQYQLRANVWQGVNTDESLAFAARGYAELAFDQLANGTDAEKTDFALVRTHLLRHQLYVDSDEVIVVADTAGVRSSAAVGLATEKYVVSPNRIEVFIAVATVSMMESGHHSECANLGNKAERIARAIGIEVNAVGFESSSLYHTWAGPHPGSTRLIMLRYHDMAAHQELSQSVYERLRRPAPGTAIVKTVGTFIEALENIGFWHGINKHRQYEEYIVARDAVLLNNHLMAPYAQYMYGAGMIIPEAAMDVIRKMSVYAMAIETVMPNASIRMSPALRKHAAMAGVNAIGADLLVQAYARAFRDTVERYITARMSAYGANVFGDQHSVAVAAPGAPAGAVVVAAPVV